MTRRRLLAVPLVLLLTLGSLGTCQETIRPPRDLHVLVVSIDGLRPDAIEKVETPNLHALMKGGSHARVARTILPSSTLPSHTSMLTGLDVKHHGVLWNDWEEGRGPIKATTCLELAGRAGYRTGLFAGKEKFRHLSRGIDDFQIPAYHAAKVAEAAIGFVRRESAPWLVFLHLADPDGAGHAHGWMTEEQFAAIRDADAALGAVLAALDETGLRERTIVFVTADHGGHGTTHGTFMEEDMRIPWIACGPGVRKNATLDREVRTFDTAPTVLSALGLEVPPGWDGTSVSEAFE